MIVNFCQQNSLNHTSLVFRRWMQQWYKNMQNANSLCREFRIFFKLCRVSSAEESLGNVITFFFSWFLMQSNLTGMNSRRTIITLLNCSIFTITSSSVQSRYSHCKPHVSKPMTFIWNSFHGFHKALWYSILVYIQPTIAPIASTVGPWPSRTPR